jgi:hypothetical protein
LHRTNIIGSVAQKLRKTSLQISVATKHLGRTKSRLEPLDIVDKEETPIDITPVAALVDGAEQKRYKVALDASKTEAHELATQSGQLACQSLCQEIQRKLPRELRDMIYEQPLTEDTTVWGEEDEDECPMCWYSDDQPACRKHFLPHLRSIDYLGVETKIEVAEIWYRTSVFQFTDLYTLSDLLRENPFDIPFHPGNLIRHVTLEPYNYEGSDDPNFWRELGARRKKLQTELPQLSTLEARAKIEVELLIGSQIVYDDDLIDLLDPVFEALGRLAGQGYRVTIHEPWAGSIAATTITAVSTAREWVKRA